MQVIDGSVLEGGGQILRIATALSALLRTPIVIENIRNNRKPPGLKNQHRTGLELAATIASAKLTGAVSSSIRVVFEPGQGSSQHARQTFMADAMTAGSTMLLLQGALPILLLTPQHDPLDQLHASETKLTLKGGTNAEKAPQVDYTQNIFIPFLQKHFLPSEDAADADNGCEDRETSARVEMKLEKRGYYPKGGGVVHVHIKPLPPGKTLRPINLPSRGRVISIRGIAHYAGLPTSIGAGMVSGALERLKADKIVSDDGMRVINDSTVTVDTCVHIEHHREPKATTTGAGSGIVLWAELEGGGFIGGDAVGRKGIDPMHIGAQAADELIKSLNNGGCIDEWLQDQIILFIALAQGTSEICCGTQGVSLHTRTAIWVTEQMTGAKFEIEQNEIGMNVLRCHGIGLKSTPP